MSSAEFVLWQAFQRLEGPLGPEREDWRSALIASVIANANRDAKKHRKAYQPKDFVPDWGQAAGVRRPFPAPEETAAKVRGFFQALSRKGGK